MREMTKISRNRRLKRTSFLDIANTTDKIGNSETAKKPIFMN